MTNSMESPNPLTPTMPATEVDAWLSNLETAVKLLRAKQSNLYAKLMPVARDFSPVPKAAESSDKKEEDLVQVAHRLRAVTRDINELADEVVRAAAAVQA